MRARSRQFCSIYIAAIVAGACQTAHAQHSHEHVQRYQEHRVPHCGLQLPPEYDPYRSAQNHERRSCCNGGDCCPRHAHIDGKDIVFEIEGKEYRVPLDDPRVIDFEFPLSDEEKRLKQIIPEHQRLRTFLGSRMSVCATFNTDGLHIMCVLRSRGGS